MTDTHKHLLNEKQKQKKKNLTISYPFNKNAKGNAKISTHRTNPWPLTKRVEEDIEIK